MPSTHSTIYLEEIMSTDMLESLTDQWYELWLRDTQASPFQSPAWALNWWRQFGAKELCSLAIHYDGRLAGLVPMFINQHGRARIINFIGHGISDYLGILAESDFAPACAQVTLEYLRINRSKWEKCDLQELRANSALVSIENLPDLPMHITAQSICPVITLPETMEAYLNMLPGPHRRKVLKAKRMLGALGHLQFEQAGERDVQHYLTELFTLHQACWNMRGQSGVLADTRLQQFHRCTASQLHQCGCGRLYRLRLGDKTLAAVYGFIKDGRYYSYLGGFDPEFENYSPGQVILLELIRECINSQLREFDFLRGTEKYKYSWQAQDEATFQVVVE